MSRASMTSFQRGLAEGFDSAAANVKVNAENTEELSSEVINLVTSGGTAVGILAFSAIGLSPTDMGEYAGSLFWVILISLLLSWLTAVSTTRSAAARAAGRSCGARRRGTGALRARRPCAVRAAPHRRTRGPVGPWRRTARCRR